jgi:hypothetical protein
MRWREKQAYGPVAPIPAATAWWVLPGDRLSDKFPKISRKFPGQIFWTPKH